MTEKYAETPPALKEIGMPESQHDWRVPPTEWRYDGRPLAEFEDPMVCADRRVAIRFGGELPRDVSLALNDAYRRGVKDARAGLADEFEQLSGQRSPALTDEENWRYSDTYAHVADRIRHPEKYSGCAQTRMEAGNLQSPNPNGESRG